MADVQVETVVNEIDAKNEKTPVEVVKSDVIEPKINEPADKAADKPSRVDKPAFVVKPKYDGRHKKRRWDFNRRDDNVKRTRTEPEDRVKRRKYLVVLGYAGANYVGMQRNPDVNTIEDELLTAMLKNKLIPEDAHQQPQYVHFQRAARTDKGVSAARQCISLKLRKIFVQMNFINRTTLIIMKK